MNSVRHYLLAVQFFTRIPVTGRLADWVGYSPAMLRASSAHFPGVGWLVAALAAGVYAALHFGLGAQPFAPLVAAVFCTLATVLMTGGFHEDGLSDVTDGLGGSYDRERALDIMKDSRIGAFGAMALVLVLTVREPLRQATAAHASPAAGVRQPGAVAAIWAEPVTRWLVIGVAFTLLAAYSFGAWNIALMVRHHGLSLQQAGWISGASAISSITGSLVSGALTDRMVRRNLRWQMGVPLVGLVLSLLSGVAYLLLPAGTLPIATVLMVLFAFFLPWWAAPSYAAISIVTPNQRRATANSMVLLAGAIVGNGLGPILTGWLSDVLNASLGGDGLRYAMLGMVSMILVGIFAFFRAMRAYPQAYRNAHSSSNALQPPRG